VTADYVVYAALWPAISNLSLIT